MNYKKDNNPAAIGQTEEQNELRYLREENIRLKALLTSHDIAWEEPPALPALLVHRSS